MDVKRLIRGTKEYAETYAELTKWWSFWKFPAPPVEMLPNNMVVSYNEGKPVCAGFIYGSDSQIAWLEWIVANPEAEKEIRSQGIEIVLQCAKMVANCLGYSVVFTSCKNPSLINKLKKAFQPTDLGMSHFIWR